MSDRTADTCEDVSVKAKTKPIVIFSCVHEKVLCSTGCGRRAAWGCVFGLRGKLEGKTCDAPLCDRCMSAHGHCPPHARMEKK